MAVRAASERGLEWLSAGQNARQASAEFSQSASGLRWAARLGFLEEQGWALGGRAAFSNSRARTAYGGINAETTPWAALGENWKLQGAVHFGLSRLESDGILLGGEFKTSAFSAGVAGGDVLRRGDSVLLRIRQPLRVESGHARVRRFFGGGGGSGGDDSLVFGAAPSGRQLDADAAYRWLGAGSGEFVLAATATWDSGHSDLAGWDAGALFSAEWDF